jgi:hypothetical protein
MSSKKDAECWIVAFEVWRRSSPRIISTKTVPTGHHSQVSVRMVLKMRQTFASFCKYDLTQRRPEVSVCPGIPSRKPQRTLQVICCLYYKSRKWVRCGPSNMFTGHSTLAFIAKYSVRTPSKTAFSPGCKAAAEEARYKYLFLVLPHRLYRRNICKRFMSSPCARSNTPKDSIRQFKQQHENAN